MGLEYLVAGRWRYVCMQLGKRLLLKKSFAWYQAKTKFLYLLRCKKGKYISQAQKSNNWSCMGVAARGLVRYCSCKSCKILVFKMDSRWLYRCRYTSYAPYVGEPQATKSKGILFQNPNGDFIMEDSWMYGCMMMLLYFERPYSVMRNTFEKAVMLVVML